MEDAYQINLRSSDLLRHPAIVNSKNSTTASRDPSSLSTESAMERLVARLENSSIEYDSPINTSMTEMLKADRLGGQETSCTTSRSSDAPATASDDMNVGIGKN